MARSQPTRIGGPGRHLQLHVVVPLPAQAAVHRTRIETDIRQPQHRGRRTAAQPVDHRGAEGPHDGRALQVQPGRVQHQAGDPVAVLRGPQRGDQPTGGVADQHQLVVVCAIRSAAASSSSGVVVQVGDEAAKVAAAQAAAVTPQVDRVEVEAQVDQLVGQMGLEEVVVPAVHVERSVPRAVGGQPADQGGDQLDVLRLARGRFDAGQRAARRSRSRPGSRGARWSRYPE